MSAPLSRNRVAASLVRLGPHGADHRVALRAGISVLVPLLVLVLVGRVEWAAFAVFRALSASTGAALLVGQLVRPAPAGPLVRDRLLKTVLGAAIAVAVLLVVPDRLRRAEGEPV